LNFYKKQKIMKIILEPTTKDEYGQRVEIEVFYDDLCMNRLAELFYQASVAYGFHPKSVSQYIDCELSEKESE